MKKAVLILGWLVFVFPCPASIIIVDDDGPADFNNIQAAIDDSNDGDTVYVFPGRYVGLGNRDIDFGGRAITVQSVAPEDPYIVAATVIDCEGLGRGFYFQNDEDPNSVLNGLTITDGDAGSGGAVYCVGTAPTIANCVVTGNTATGSGGGIFGGWGPISNCTISNNSAAVNGGGVYACSGQISNCSIVGNTAGVDGGGLGECYEVTHCMISNNSAGEKGGGLHNMELLADITGSTFTGNSADNGAGIYNMFVPLRLSSCAFSGNTASADGGGLYCFQCDAEVTNCTFSGNSAASASGGIYNSDSELRVKDSIVWSNTDSGGPAEPAQISGDVPEVTFSCIQDDDPNDANIPFGGEDSNNIDDNPRFVRGPNNGGDGWGDDPCTPGVDEGANDDFGDLHLRAGSPCINSGDPFGWIKPASVDMDGQPRLMGLIVDMGADEFFTPTIIITKPQGGEVWASGSTHKIEWESRGVSGGVDISYSHNNGAYWRMIEYDVADTGSYVWQLPGDVDSDQCLVLVVPSAPDPNIVLSGSGVFTIRPYSPGPAAASKWKSLGGDFDRVGLSEDRGPELGCVKWEFEVDGAISASVTIGPNEMVYVPCEDGNLYTLDANGSLLWTYEANSPLISAATLGPDGTAYVGSKDGRLYAIDIDGNLRWTHTTGGMVYSSPAVSPDGNNVYVCSEDGKLYALGRDGSELWSFETDAFGVIEGAIFASPTIADDGTVYIGGLYDSNLYALDPNDGNTIWVCHFDSDGWLFTCPVLAPDGTIYQTLLYDPHLYAIDPNNGSTIWGTNLSEVHVEGDVSSSYWFDPYYYEVAHGFDLLDCEARYSGANWNVGDSGWSEPVVGPDGRIYVSFDDPWLRVVGSDGAIERIIRLGSESGFDLAVGDDGLIYAASNDSNLYVASADGIEISRFHSNEHWLNLPVVPGANTVVLSDSRDNSLLINYENNRLWAISSDACGDQELDLYWQGGPQDLNGDGVVDFLDVAIVAADWLRCRACYKEPGWRYCFRSLDHYDTTLAPTDVNRDRYVNFADLRLVVEQWLAGY